jgi:hypothetical protein
MAELRRPRAVLVAAACGLIAIALAAPAFGVQPGFLPFFSNEPAPAQVVQDFSSLDVGAPRGMAPGALAGEARKVLSPTAGQQHTLWVAPTRSGGFCVLLDRLGGGCDRDRQVPLAIAVSRAAPSAPIVLSGSVLPHQIGTLELRYEDGTADPVDLTWVSKPIDAGFFALDIPPAHQVKGARPRELVARSSDGAVVLRRDFPQQVFLIPWNAQSRSSK